MKDKKASEKKMANKGYTQVTKGNAYDEDENFAEELSIRRVDGLLAEY